MGKYLRAEELNRKMRRRAIVKRFFKAVRGVLHSFATRAAGRSQA